MSNPVEMLWSELRVLEAFSVDGLPRGISTLRIEVAECAAIVGDDVSETLPRLDDFASPSMEARSKSWLHAGINLFQSQAYRKSRVLGCWLLCELIRRDPTFRHFVTLIDQLNDVRTEFQNPMLLVDQAINDWKAHGADLAESSDNEKERETAYRWRIDLAESDLPKSVRVKHYLKARDIEPGLNSVDDRLRALLAKLGEKLDVPMLRVAAKIADANTSFDRSLIQRYKALELPIQLAQPAVPLMELRQQLICEFPWAEEAISTLMAGLSLNQLLGRRDTWFPPVLMVGPPGVGKTRLANRFAAVVGSPVRLVPAAGSETSRLWVGATRGWSSAQPGFVVRLMLESGFANPLIIVDEIDKGGGTRGHNGRFTDPLHGLLEPGSAAAHFDDFLCCSINASRVCWIATANTLDDIDETILSRFRVVTVGKPGPEHGRLIAIATLADLRRRFGVARPDDELMDAAAWAALDRGIQSGWTPRQIGRATEEQVAESLARRAAVEGVSPC